MINEKQLKLINKINKDIQTICSCEDAEKIGYAYMRITENLRKLCLGVTGVNMTDILKDLLFTKDIIE